MAEKSMTANWTSIHKMSSVHLEQPELGTTMAVSTLRQIGKEVLPRGFINRKAHRLRTVDQTIMTVLAIPRVPT